MSIANPQRPSFDAKAQKLLRARWWTWVVNALAIAILPVIVVATRKEPASYFAGPEISGFVSGIVFYTFINLVCAVRLKVACGLSKWGYWDYWLGISGMFLFICIAMWDTWLQADSGRTLFGANGLIWLICGVALSLGVETYIAVVLRDVEDGVNYTIEFTQRVRVTADSLHAGSLVVTDIRRSN